ncbi:2-pyrone-4,6-dicarboxylate lactonase OS=Castellaniella defragrans OX=75697 GN=HNR28_001886 PE=4 SV=1 [Castellaniella defragrans]
MLIHEAEGGSQGPEAWRSRARVSTAFPPPPGSCDCHVHLFEPDRFPYVARRSYTPGTVRVADLLAFEQRLGIERVVLVQPSVYGTDNAALLAGLRQLGPQRARAVVVIDPENVSRAQLQALQDQGVRGIRLNLATGGESDSAVALERLQRAAAVVGPLGWSLQVYADIEVIAALEGRISGLGVPLVLDHFAGLRAGGLGQGQAFDTVLDLVRAGSVYVKLSAPYRASAQSPDHADLDAFAIRLIEARPDRMVWASDWPHTGRVEDRSGDVSRVEPFRNVDDAAALGRVPFWAATDALRHRILVDNPATLYGFEAGLH